MNRGQKVPNRECPAEERHRGSVGVGRPRLLGEWFSLPAGGIAPRPPPPSTYTLHTGLVPGLLSMPLGTDLQPRPVGLPPGLVWRGNVNLEFPTGHRGWEKEQGRAWRPAWRLWAEAADPRPPLPPPMARGPTSRQHSTSGWLFQPEGSRADVTSELQAALAGASPWASCLFHEGALDAQRATIVPREFAPAGVRASLSTPCAVSEMILFKTFFFSCM